MTPTVKLIEETLIKKFQPSKILVKDDKEEHIGHAHADSGHFTVIIQSSAFNGKTAIQQHRLVYEALGSLMQTHIHALRIKSESDERV